MASIRSAERALQDNGTRETLADDETRCCSWCRRRRLLYDDGQATADWRPSPGSDANDEIKHCDHVHTVCFYNVYKRT